MKSNEEIAIQSFRSGLNCAQSVVTAYSDRMGFDKVLAENLSCGFGGGMGRLQETCGAVTGAFMILGIYNCNKYSDQTERKNSTYTMVQQLSNEFKNIHNVTDCRSLLNCDLKTEEGLRIHKAENQSKTICEKCIVDAVSILDKMLEKK
ncbi:MAG: C-GCAxxG-C-C family protein [Paludibacter sp.]|nr:C-GCAxxG-C-C family protein [Paludibacter sp.]